MCPTSGLSNYHLVVAPVRDSWYGTTLAIDTFGFKDQVTTGFSEPWVKCSCRCYFKAHLKKSNIFVPFVLLL